MKVRIFEVGPRDGLQNESKPIDISDKITFIEMLMDAGHTDLEAGAFVNPQKVPQMTGSLELIKQLPKSKTNLWALVPNSKGFESFKASGLKHMAIFTAASNTFNQKNINATIDESFDRFNEFLPEARKLKFKIRGYVSTCFGCPYEGAVNPKAVLKVTERLLKIGASEISVGDTIGVADPIQVKALSKQLLKLVGPKKLALHLHDTRGTALANIYAGLESGITAFDSSSGGLGGCPYAPGASGNVATEDLVYMLHKMGIKTGIDLQKQVKASLFIQEKLGKPLPSKALHALKN